MGPYGKAARFGAGPGNINPCCDDPVIQCLVYSNTEAISIYIFKALRWALSGSEYELKSTRQRLQYHPESGHIFCPHVRKEREKGERRGGQEQKKGKGVLLCTRGFSQAWIDNFENSRLYTCSAGWLDEINSVRKHRSAKSKIWTPTNGMAFFGYAMCSGRWPMRC